MPGTSEGVRKAWLKRKRKGKKAAPKPRPETTAIMKKGDTLASMAKQWGVSVKSIIKLNGFKDPSEIKVGINVKIPAILSKEEKAKNAETKAFEANKKKEAAAKRKEERERKRREKGK